MRNSLQTNPKIMSFWYRSIFVLFFTRGFLLATWSSRGPAIDDAIDLDLVSFGWYVACLSFGSIIGVLVSERQVEIMGSRNFLFLTSTWMGLALVLLGLTLTNGEVVASYFLTFLLGVPLGMADYDNNLEATRINNLSAKNKVPVLHGAYSLGVFLGAGFVGLSIIFGASLLWNFVIVGIFFTAISVVAAFGTPKDSGRLKKVKGIKTKAIVTMRHVIRSSLNVRIAFIAFAFIFAEGVGLIWIPIALVKHGYDASTAAFAYTLFGLGFMLSRFVGGVVTDRIGRVQVILVSTIVATTGLIMFVQLNILSLALIGAFIWGLGNSIGIAMCVSAMGDQPEQAGTRLRFLWTVVYISNLVVGPAIGLLSAYLGLPIAMVVPVFLFLVVALIRHSVAPQETSP